MYLVSVVLKPFFAMHYKCFRTHIKRVHLGCGNDYMEGFINIDGNYRCKVDYLLDIRAGLPFPSDSMHYVYSCHMLEHLYPSEAAHLIAEIYRVLNPYGYARLLMPDFDHAIRICNGEIESKWPRAFESPSAQAINYLFCDGQHRYAYSYELVKEVAEKAGFAEIERSTPNDRNVKEEMPPEPIGSLAVHLLKH